MSLPPGHHASRGQPSGDSVSGLVRKVDLRSHRCGEFAPLESWNLEGNVKLVVNKRIGGRRILLVLASRPSRPRPSAVELKLAGVAAATATAAYLIGRRSRATDEETRVDPPGGPARYASE